MSEIRRAIIKSYDAVAHKASVQIAGSLAVWLDAVRVATNIPAADVVAGRQCTVLFLDPSNQDDAVVISIQGALPSGGGGGGGPPDIHEDGSLVKASADPIDFKGGFDVAVDGAGVDVTLDIDESPLLGLAKLAGRAGGQTLIGGAAASEDLELQSTADATRGNVHVLDDLFVTGNIGVGITPAVQTNVRTLFTGIDIGALIGLDFIVRDLSSDALNTAVTGIRGIAQGFRFTAGSYNTIYGADIVAQHLTTRPIITVHGGRFRGTYLGAGSLTDLAGIASDLQTLSAPTTARGLWVFGTLGPTLGATAVGVDIADITGPTNRYLIRAGPATPNLRLDAGAPPNAGLAAEGDSQEWLAWMENGVVTLRRSRTKTFATLAAGDRVLVAV